NSVCCIRINQLQAVWFSDRITQQSQNDFEYDRHPFVVRCSQGHTIQTDSRRVRDFICRECEKAKAKQNRKKRIEILEKKITDENYALKKRDNRTLWLQCNNNHPEYKVLISNFLKGVRCPYCARRGFNKDRDGILYFNEIVDKNDNTVAIKMGITNRQNASRARQQLKSSDYASIETRITFKAKGNLIFEAERKIKDEFSRYFRYLNKKQMPDGYTETFHPRHFREIYQAVSNLLM
ncbi:hypothetical protein, partial [Vibrio vulnificus]|uniref:hypothetical protein n=1 Tax=Vibrio vulnificus TaxID=672 RepID=UPI003243007D